jgi:type VI secretion system protein ImpG
MNNEFLNYFHDELNYLKQNGDKFAKAYPKTAQHLKLNTQGSDDPQIALLLESFAFMNARIQEKLNNGFPELSESLLNIMYPHYQAPIPAMSIAQFHAAPDLSDKKIIPSQSLLESDPDLGNKCYFQTSYDVSLLPIKVEFAELTDHLQPAPGQIIPDKTSGYLHLKLSCMDSEMTFDKLKPEKIRFFLNGQAQNTFPLHTLLLTELLEIVIMAQSNTTPITLHLKKTALQTVGYDNHEGLLPYPPQSLMAYRLLTEFFIFPEKFLFLDLDIKPDAWQGCGNKIDIFLYVKNFNMHLKNKITADTFALGCTPIVNLFKKIVEPLEINNQKIDYLITPDYRESNQLEIYSIDKVIGSNNINDESEYLPLYGIKNNIQTQSHPNFWLSKRKSDASNKYNANSSDVYISLINLDTKPDAIKKTTLHIEAHCTNRAIPAGLFYNKENFPLQLVKESAPINSICLLMEPTSLRQSINNSKNHNTLLSHLSLNYINLSDENSGLNSLKQLLDLYDLSSSHATQAITESISRLKSTKIIRRLPFGIINTFCQGIKIELELDANAFIGSSAYLFASVLEHFFALYCSINSFVELQVTNTFDKKIIFQSTPKVGSKALL